RWPGGICSRASAPQSCPQRLATQCWIKIGRQSTESALRSTELEASTSTALVALIWHAAIANAANAHSHGTARMTPPSPTVSQRVVGERASEACRERTACGGPRSPRHAAGSSCYLRSDEAGPSRREPALCGAPRGCPLKP